MKHPKFLVRMVVPGVALTLLLGDAVFAKNSQVTPEQRKKMAALHEKMAKCLRSDKPMDECRTEARKNCQQMMGKSGSCPMMDDMAGTMGYEDRDDDTSKSGSNDKD